MESKPHRAHWFRWLGALVLGLLLSISASAQVVQQPTPVDLPQITTTSGLSIDHDFYEDVTDGIRGDVAGHTGVYSGAAFTPYTDKIEEEFEDIEDLFTQGYDAAITWLASVLPEIALIIAAIVAILLALFCGSFQPTVELTLPQQSVYAAFTVEDVQLTQTSTGHRFDVSLNDVGLISETFLEVGIGSCTDSSKNELLFVYPDVDYVVTVDFLPGGGTQVSAQLVGGLPPLDRRYDGGSNVTANALWSFANVDIGGQDLAYHIRAFAISEVPLQLEAMFTNWWPPYLPQSGWLVDLSGSKQTQRYGQNAVVATVGPALYQPLVSALPDTKVRVTFDNLHSAVSADPLATCADTSFDPGPAVTPNFPIESTLAKGTYHTSFKTFEHRIAAGIRAAVGHRSKDKPGSDFVVEHDMQDLVPEAGANDFRFLVGDVTSPVYPVPLSGAQKSALINTQITSGGRLSGATMSAIDLEIEVCEVRRSALPNPLGPGGDAGYVVHDVVLKASLLEAGAPILQETWDASFVGRLVLSKVPTKDSIEFRTVDAELSSLVNQAGVDVAQVSLNTPFANAPVSLFLRAFVGDNTVPFPQTDNRVFYMIEGLAGPLVERAAHGMVVLPGLDFPPFDGATFGFIQAAVQYHGDDYELGLDFNHPALCSSIEHWGTTQALVGGVPSGSDHMLTLEVDWMPHVAMPGFKTRTSAAVATVTAPNVLQVNQNPSRFDTGFLSVTYSPANGDASRMMNASGYRLGAFLPGGGMHFVASTAVAYKALRQSYPSSMFPEVTFELRPYHQPVMADCPMLFPGPIDDLPGHMGGHHEDPGYADVYEVLTFETQKDCKGIGKCDGVRVAAMWTAPLFFDCPGPDGPWAADEHSFDTVEGTLRVPPTTYVYVTENCMGFGTPGQGEPMILD